MTEAKLRTAHAVITGGAGDIGRAIARRLISQGTAVTILDIKTPEVAAKDLGGMQVSGYVSVDVQDYEGVRAALDSLPPFDIVISNAGIVQSAPFLEITPGQWKKQLDVNLSGGFHTGQAAAKIFVERKQPGRIIFTSSWVQDHPWPEIAAYAVSKSGLKMLTQCMAAELAPFGILVNAVAPGIVAAGLARHQLEAEPQYARRAARAIPLGRMQSPEQVAAAVSFLCSEQADYMTGSTLLVDGGCSIAAV